MQYVRLESSGEVLTIRLNRPEVRNAFDPQMISELTESFKQAEKRKDVRIIILRGEGKSFCAGADLEWMKSMAKYSKAKNSKDSDQLFAMFASGQACNKPIVGMLHGHVMGGGLGLAAICDFACAEVATKFCFSETKLGLVPAVISSFVLQKMQYSRALQAMLLAEAFSAEQALQWGLVSFVGNSAQIESECQRLMQALLRNGPEAIGETKKLLRDVRAGKGDVRKKSVSVIAARRVSPEGQQGLQSFFHRTKTKMGEVR